MADNEGLDTWSWSEMKDWRNWHRTRLARRRPPSRKRLIFLWVAFVVFVGLAIGLGVIWPNHRGNGWLLYPALLVGIDLGFYGLASLSRRRPQGKLFDQDRR